MDQHLLEVWRSAKSKGAAKLVLSALAKYADADGISCPSNDEIANEVGFAPSTIKVHLQELKNAGDIAYASTGGQKRGDRRRLVLGAHLCPTTQKEHGGPAEMAAMLKMPMRNQPESGPLFMLKRHRLRMLRRIGVCL